MDSFDNTYRGQSTTGGNIGIAYPEHVCPHCGRCRHCGQGAQPSYQPVWIGTPYVSPVGGIGGITFGNETITGLQAWN